MNYICLIDCDNFYASVEKIFNPSFRNRPLVVVSGKDGIVIARSKEAKALNIPMCAPSFEYKSLFLKEDVILRPPNFTLYKDMAERVRETVATFNFPTFFYSIDEMFLKIPEEIYSPLLLEHMQQKIKRWTGIDVSIGISKTKTLAKIATHLAKKLPTHRKSLITQEEINIELNSFTAQDIWGIGSASSKKLKENFVKTAKDLIDLNTPFLNKLLGLQGLRIVEELKGNNSYPFLQKDLNKSIQITKTFPSEISSINTLKEIISTFTADGCQKLRKIGKNAPYFHIFLESSRFKEKKTSFYKTFSLDEPSNYTPHFLALKEIFFEELIDDPILIKRAGLCFSGLLPKEATQTSLFSTKKQSNLMEPIDKINAKFGKNTITFACQSKSFQKNTPSCLKYTTSWDNLLKIHI
jgi:DNA polymerase V